MTQNDSNAVTQRGAKIRLLALDVDGVMTDGRLYYSDTGGETKAFNIKDGLGIKLLQRAGVQVAIITGRSSTMVERRASELGIKHIIQGREDKRQALLELCQTLDLSTEDCAYMGDDLPDLGAITAAGLGMTVADGCDSVRAAADWVSTLPGGGGAVREACEFILTARGDWLSIESEFA